DPLPPGACLRLGTHRLRTRGWRLAVAPDGKRLALVCSGFLEMHDLPTGKKLLGRECPEGLAAGLTFAPAGDLLRLWGDKACLLFDDSGRQLHAISPGDDHSIHAVSFSADGKRIALGAKEAGGPGRATVWEAATGKKLGGFATSLRSPIAVALSP